MPNQSIHLIPFSVRGEIAIPFSNGTCDILDLFR